MSTNTQRGILTCRFVHRSELFGLWQRGHNGNIQARHIVANIRAIDAAAEKPAGPKAACVVCADASRYQAAPPDVFVALAREENGDLVVIASICRRCIRQHKDASLLPAVAAGFERNCFEEGSTLQIAHVHGEGAA